MRIALIPYPGEPRACYEQLIAAALRLAKSARMQEMARWTWTRFSTWLHGIPFEMDDGRTRAASATACDPPQRMREFPSTMNCWERVLHQLAWFAARGAERATIYDHHTLVGRHIEVLVPPTTYLGAATSLPVRPVANADDQVMSGVFGGLQGGLQGGMLGASAGPYGALAGFILGAGLGAAQGALNPKSSAPPPPKAELPAPVSQPSPVAAPVPTQNARAPPPAAPTVAPLPVLLSKAIPKKQPDPPKPKRAPMRKKSKRHRKRSD